MTPLAVVHIINGLALGEAETLMYGLVTRDSDQQRVVSLGRAGWYSRRLKEPGVAVHHLDMDSPIAVTGAFLRLKTIMRESRADVVQCWMYGSNVFGGLMAKAASKPVVWGMHCSSFDTLRPSSRVLVHLSGLLAGSIPDYIINCSTRSAQLHRELGYSRVPGGVVHNGYDSSTFVPDERERISARHALGLPADTFVLGSVARWHAQKDIRNLLAAIRMVHDRGSCCVAS
jgi:glycosyltransferase involved in cell wall biosynthesis